MSRQLILFWNVAASQKVYGKTTKNHEEFVNAFAADERCSPSLLLQQAKLADAAWKRSIMVRTRWLWQMFCLPVRITVCDEKLHCSSSEIPVWYKFPVWYKSPVWCADTEIHTFKATNSSICGIRKKCALCSDGGGERGVTPMWNTLRSEN